MRSHNEQKMGRKTVVDAAGKPAISRFYIEQYLTNMTYLSVDIETGRTHQIRAHTAAVGHPIVGDTVYGWLADHEKAVVPRIMLHAHQLAFHWRDEAKPRVFTAALPEDFTLWLGK